MSAGQIGYTCRRCGIVRLGDVTTAPWCRHVDVALPADRMEPVSDQYLDRLGLSRGVLVEWEHEERKPA